MKDEKLRGQALEFGPKWVKRHPDQPKTWTNGHWSDGAMVEFATAFASSILEELQRKYAEALGGRAAWVANESVQRKRAETAEQQLAEARAHCCGDYRLELEAMRDHLKNMGIEEHTEHKDGIAETTWRNVAAETARAQGMREAAEMLKGQIAELEIEAKRAASLGPSSVYLAAIGERITALEKAAAAIKRASQTERKEKCGYLIQSKYADAQFCVREKGHAGEHWNGWEIEPEPRAGRDLEGKK